jgi:acetyl esterase/lipase
MQTHPLSREDAVAAAGLRAEVAAFKGKLAGPAARAPFDDVMERVAVPEGVTFAADAVGGVSGLWAKPPKPRKGAAIIHAHGGWFNLGSTHAYRNFVGHIALSAGTDAFIPDFGLAPENPFPAAVTDIEACYRGLIDKGTTKIAVTGDSAGGALALILLSIASQDYDGGKAPVGAVAVSPVTDLALTGETYQSRADADPYFTKSQVAGLVSAYLGATDPKNPLASPLYGDLRGLPPIRLHVGDDELLLAEVDVWMGMPHGFVSGVHEFEAARLALKQIGNFLTERLS